MLKLQRIFGACTGTFRTMTRPAATWNYVGDAASQVDSQVAKVFDGIVCGRRAALAKGITLVESLNPRKKAMGQALLARLLMHMKEKEMREKKYTFRIGVSGAPGSGKSTLIESLGTHLTAEGHKVAVLAVDPSSVSSGGSILGDKTRMFKLAQNEQAYIRPSPNKCTLGGVTRSTNESIGLCEGAGYDVILVETVGVGQSEIAVADMVDMFCVVIPPAAGDELQGLKKGIIEVADVVIINKADGDLMAAARRAQAEYTSALKLMRKKSSLWTPKVLRVSSLMDQGLVELWQLMKSYHQILVDSGELVSLRDRQRIIWMWNHTHDQLIRTFESDPSIRELKRDLERQVHQGHLSPGFAADMLLNDFFTKRLPS